MKTSNDLYLYLIPRGCLVISCFGNPCFLIGVDIQRQQFRAYRIQPMCVQVVTKRMTHIVRELYARYAIAYYLSSIYSSNAYMSC
jgi:hypothetical protein